MESKIEKELKALSISYLPAYAEKLEKYLEVLNHWNKAYNLTGIKKENQVSYIVLDSLSLHSFLQGKHIVDVGTGAGIPGIPLAILNPEKQFTLLDSNGKKLRFLTQVKQALSLDNVEIVQSRVEDYRPVNLFNTIISRAFTEVGELVRLCQHLCALDGSFLAMKSETWQNEKSALPAGFCIHNIHKYKVPGIKSERFLLVIGRSKKSD